MQTPSNSYLDEWINAMQMHKTETPHFGQAGWQTLDEECDLSPHISWSQVDWSI